MKFLRFVVVMVLLVSLSLLFLSGCAKKEETKEEATEQLEQVTPEDTTAVPEQAPEVEEPEEATE